jgi:type I site-specific restriction endonuclease
MNGQNEAFSRVLIDKALEYSGWNLLDGKQVQFELHTSNGRADYLLKDKLGRVLCVLEAKREDRGGPGCLRKNSASLSRASAEVRLPWGVAAG